MTGDAPDRAGDEGPARRGRSASGSPPTQRGGAGGAYEGLTELLGYRLPFALVSRALTHRSFADENGGLPTNRRLTILGDSVLDLVVTDARMLGTDDR